MKRLLLAGLLGSLACWAWLPLLPSKRAQLDTFSTYDNDDGSTSSEQTATILPLDSQQLIWSNIGLERVARAYWYFLARTTLGLIHISYHDDCRRLKLGPLTLIEFTLPSYSLSPHFGLIGWQIRGGLLAKQPGGSLTIELEEDSSGWIDVTVAVNYFFPSLPTQLYQKSQALVHTIMTRAFLRSLAHGYLPQSKTGRFSRPAPPVVSD